MDFYSNKLDELYDKLDIYPEDNFKLLNDYKELAEQARKDTTEEAGNAILSIAYVIGERITSNENLEPYYQDALKILESFRDNESYFFSLESLALYLLEHGKQEEALVYFKRIVNEKSNNFESADYNSLNNLAMAYERLGDLEQALITREKALETWEHQGIVEGTSDVAFYLQAHTELGRLLSKLGRHQEAEQYFRSAYKECHKIYDSVTTLGHWHISVIDSALDIACCLFHQNKLSEAKDLIVKEMPESEKGLDEMSSMYASVARQCYQQALQDLESCVAPTAASRPSSIITKGILSENN